MTDDRDRDDSEGTLTPERARELILARRARFMAAALAGMASAGCGDDGSGPRICLDIAFPLDAARPDAEAGASVCLTVDAQVRDGGVDSGPSDAARTPTDARADDATVTSEGGLQPLDGGPQVCLSIFKRENEGEAPDDR